MRRSMSTSSASLAKNAPRPRDGIFRPLAQEKLPQSNGPSARRTRPSPMACRCHLPLAAHSSPLPPPQKKQGNYVAKNALRRQNAGDKSPPRQNLVAASATLPFLRPWCTWRFNSPPSFFLRTSSFSPSPQPIDPPPQSPENRVLSRPSRARCSSTRNPQPPAKEPPCPPRPLPSPCRTAGS
jgi:hypothetical protein